MPAPAPAPTTGAVAAGGPDITSALNPANPNYTREQSLKSTVNADGTTTPGAGTVGGSYAGTTASPATQSPIQTTTSMRTTAATNSALLDAKLGTLASSTVPQGPTTAPAPNAAGTGQPNAGGTGEPAKNSVNITQDIDNGDGTRNVTYSDGTSAKVTVTKNADGSETYKESGPASGKTPADPFDVSTQVKALTDAATAKMASVNTTLDGLKASSDASTNALIASIQQIYTARVGELQAANATALAVKGQEGLRTGRSQYAPVLQAGILSDEEQAGVMRVAELQGQMLQLVAQANKDRDSNNLSMFNDRMTQLNKISSDLTDSVAKLHADAIAHQKAIEDMKTSALNNQKTTLDIQMNTAKTAAPGLISSMAAVKDPAKQAALVVATAKKLGVDPMLLMGELQTASNAQNKSDVELAHVRAQISDLNRQHPGGGTPGNGTPTLTVTKSGTLDSKSLLSLGSALETGGTLGGATYAGRGADSYVDPGLYQALYSGAKEKFGATVAQQFLNKYPPEKYINPANAGSAELDPVIANRVSAKANKAKPVAPTT